MKHIPPYALRRVEIESAVAPTFRDELLRCVPTLRRYARMLGDADFADDLVQATLARALEYEAAYSAQGAMAAWVRQIMKNLARDQRKHRERYVLFSEMAKKAFNSARVRTRSFSTSLPPTFFMPCRKFSVKISRSLA